MLHVFIYLFIYLTTCLVFFGENSKCVCVTESVAEKGNSRGDSDWMDAVTRTLTGEGCAVIGSCTECFYIPDLVSPWMLFGSNARNS